MKKTITGMRPKVEMSKAIVSLTTIGNIANKCIAIDPSRTPEKAYTKKTK